MKREGLTITMIFLAESANYGEGIGNISSLKKMTRGNHEKGLSKSKIAKILDVHRNTLNVYIKQNGINLS